MSVATRRRWLIAFLLAGILAGVALGTRSCWHPAGSRQGRAAAAFARALVSKRYEAAHGQLSRSLAARMDVAKLRETFEGMVGYGGGPPTDVRVMLALDYWPDKQPGDIGWAYAAISGADFSEAVTVIVAEEDGADVIREIEWGRP